MLSLLDSLMIVYSSSHCHATFVNLKKNSLYLNRGYKLSKYQLHYFKCELTFRVGRFKGFFGFFFHNNHIRVEDFIDMFCFVE
jgi:hypothetical protein